MICVDCTTAEANPRSVLYQSHCTECQARMLANGPKFWEASMAEAMTPDYRSALQKTFGARWQEGHQRVKHFAQRIQEASQP